MWPIVFLAVTGSFLSLTIVCLSVVLLLQEGGPLPGPENGLLSNTWKWIVRGDTGADKARDFIGKGCPDREQQGKGTQENCSATWLAVLGFMVMGLVSGLSLAITLTQGPFWWPWNRSAKMDSSEEDSGRLVGHVDWRLLSPFDLSRILLVGGGLLVPCSLPGSPVVK